MITLVGKEGVTLVVALGVLLYVNWLMVGVWTNCPSGSCSRLRDTVPKSYLLISVCPSPLDDIPK